MGFARLSGRFVIKDRDFYYSFMLCNFDRGANYYHEMKQ